MLGTCAVCSESITPAAGPGLLAARGNGEGRRPYHLSCWLEAQSGRGIQVVESARRVRRPRLLAA